MQAQFLGIAGQIGGKGALPTAASGLSDGLSWTNFHIFTLFPKGTGKNNETEGENGSECGNRTSDREMSTLELNCEIIQTSVSELGGTLLSVLTGVGAAVVTRIPLRLQAILSNDMSSIRSHGELTAFQLLGLTWTELAQGETNAGSYEIPIFGKAWLGLAESSSEAFVSGCPQYTAGGIIILLMMGSFTVFLCGLVVTAIRAQHMVFEWSGDHHFFPTSGFLATRVLPGAIGHSILRTSVKPRYIPLSNSQDPELVLLSSHFCYPSGIDPRSFVISTLKNQIP